MNSDQDSLSYQDAGVDIQAGDELVDAIKPLVKTTFREGALGNIGGFGALFEVPKRYSQPVLVAGTDGVGTKLMLATAMDRHDTIGIDLVAMCVNDVLVQGAEPLFFLDYFATGKLQPAQAKSVIGGIAEGCRQSGAALIGGETAEMPGLYHDNEYDLAGFCVGAVERDSIITGASIDKGDIVIGLPSSGPHSNGYSLIRKILEHHHIDLAMPFEGATLGEALLKPTRIYVKPVLDLIARLPVKGLAHITGGGIPGNLARVMPDTVSARLSRSSWPMPEIFHWLQQTGNVDDAEMLRTFNCGIGMIIIVAEPESANSIDVLVSHGIEARIIGEIINRQEHPVDVQE